MSIDMLMAYLCAQYRFLNDPWIASLDTDEAVNLHDRIPDGRGATRYEEADLRLMGEDIRRSLEECVGRWKPEWRRFLWLKMFMEMNEADICRACNVSRVSYPLEQMYSDLRRAFEDLGVENENDAFLLASDTLFELCGQEVDKATLDKRDTRP